MEELRKRYSSTSKALNNLKKNIGLFVNEDPISFKYYEQCRSAAIQSFEFSLDTLWKFIKEYLIYIQRISFDTPTPKSVFRECWTINIINESEFNKLSKLISDRNLTSHSYNEYTAEEISKKLPEYCKLMEDILNRIDTSTFNKI